MHPDGVVLRSHASHVGLATIVAQQRAGHTHGSAGILHMHHGASGVLCFNLHRRVRTTGRRTTDQQRNGEAFALHFASKERHLLERRRDQTAQPDDVDVLGTRRLQNSGT